MGPWRLTVNEAAQAAAGFGSAWQQQRHPIVLKLEVTLRPATDVLHLQTTPPTHPSDLATTHQPAGGEKSLN